ncbi:hypothetical protein RHSIM_Rhsim02G0224400 [Rhododendron simsii]|uniref:KIB1-4 beta-propeller domain-containing protein n=1 Tax=Rhododendron simsii TaxID=118357 RepID=A0A834LV83_RHOSS|nr:hypothetical protein RHSIM_Rhsim02G0224400 [Rhododendron simsii]
MGNWAELPEDLLVLTAKKITLFEDFLSFSGVCRSWRSVAINDNFKGSEQIPWLMLSDRDKPNERKFVSLRKGGVICTVNLSEARGKRRVETLGWLVTLAEDGEMNLLHPFTRVQINLPHVTTFKDYHMKSFLINTSFIQKAVLSSRPEESKDYVLVVILGGGYVCYWRPGDKSWTDVIGHVASFPDIIFHDGLFYGLMCSFVFAFDVWGPDPTRPWIVLHRPDRPKIGSNEQPFLVESAGVLLLGKRDFRNSRFQVIQTALKEKGRWVEITTLGDNALFLGDNASISVDASKFRGIKANRVYCTDKYWEFYERGVNHTGIYCMEDGRKSPCYEEESFDLICPPLWVNPSSL